MKERKLYATDRQGLLTCQARNTRAIYWIWPFPRTKVDDCKCFENIFFSFNKKSAFLKKNGKNSTIASVEDSRSSVTELWYPQALVSTPAGSVSLLYTNTMRQDRLWGHTESGNTRRCWLIRKQWNSLPPSFCVDNSNTKIMAI